MTTQPNTEPLKAGEFERCPFCGEQPALSKPEWRDERRYVAMDISCCCEMTVCIGWGHAKNMSKDEIESTLRERALNAWNRRTAPSPAEVGLIETRGCTCHPDDNPPVPCAKQYALHDCKQATTGLPNDWDDKILDAMEAAFFNQRHSPRRVFDGEIVGLRNDDTQIGVEFAIEQIKAMRACRALNQRLALKEGE